MMMFGFSWLMMALILAVPAIVIILLVIGAAGLFQSRDRSVPAMVIHAPITPPSVDASRSSNSLARYCPHCGAGLQSDWTHCPQCGAPIQ